jgi:uncharacterized metal-binding protein
MSSDSPAGCACEKCAVAANEPQKCPMTVQQADVLDMALAVSNDDPLTHGILEAHSMLLGRGSTKWPRLEHIREFSLHMGVKKVGLACCSMFLPHAKVAAAYLGEEDIKSVIVCCKVGAVRLEDLGITRDIGYKYHLCNPVGQAFVLNEHDTDMNVLLGLCAPHDMTFSWHSKAPSTTLFAKEYISKHAPFATMDAMTNGPQS